MLATLDNSGTLGRQTRDEVVLSSILSDKITEFNPDIPAEQIEVAVKELSRDRSSMQPIRANKEIYHLMRDGGDVEFRDNDGAIRQETIRVIDWKDPENNDYLLVSQLWVSGKYGNKRPNLVAFVSGFTVILFAKEAGATC